MSNYGLWALVGPTAWPLWALLLAALAIWRPNRATRALAGVAIVASVAVMATPLGYYLIRTLEMRFPVPKLADVDDIVVLAGAERLSASRLSMRAEYSAAAERVIEGAALANRFPDARLWIAGGVRAEVGHRPDVFWTTDTWQRLGIPADRIVVVDGTRDTCENATGVAAGRPSRRMVLVTSAFHMPRAIACFRQAGLDPIPYPVDFRSWEAVNLDERLSGNFEINLVNVDLALHEWTGLAVYRLQDRIATMTPAVR